MGNPWKALSSYDINDKCCFCGRDEDIVKLCSLIEYNQVVTIYGKSGIGKTSLLKAGVYPQLLIGDYLPKFIRFGEYEDDERSYAEIIHSVLPKKNIDLAEKNIDYTAKDFFCQFFKENEILDDNGNQVIPVIILDQFEELFDERQGRIDLLLQQIVEWKNYSGKMVSDCHFVFSIREDDLYLLEEMIDNYRYNSLKNCRYRVRRVTRKGAEEIIQIPGKDYIRDEEVVSKILDLIGAGQNKEYYEASELSLMCSMLYNAMNNRSEKSITMELVEKIGISSVVDYYENGVKGISAKEKIILEKEFIKDEGRRNFISEEDFKDLFKSAKTRESLISGDNKILSIANGKVEIIHDMLAKAIFKTKLQRVKKEKIRALEIVAWIVIMFLFGGALWKAVDNVSISKNTITYLNEDHINNCPSKRIECIASGYISISNCYDLEHLVIKDLSFASKKV